LDHLNNPAERLTANAGRQLWQADVCDVNRAKELRESTRAE
jgi:hypothetical protein